MRIDASLINVHRQTWVALLAALTAAGAYIHVPLGPVPFSLQTLFVLLSGFLLGPVYGPLSMGLYLLAGFLGLPVFSGGKAGLAPLLGPTGGFLLGFLAQSALAGLARRNHQETPLVRFLAFGLAGTAGLYALGLPWLAMVLQVNMSRALGFGLTPFILGDVLKIIAAALAARFLLRTGLLPR